MTTFAFENRSEGGSQLAAQLRRMKLIRPLVVAIPRGGVAVGAALARDLTVDLDFVLTGEAPAPGSPGGLSEGGQAVAQAGAAQRAGLSEIERREKLFRAARPRVPVAGRSVILTDDGIETGGTMMAALGAVRAHGPREIIVAIPVAPSPRLLQIAQHCDHVVCLETPQTLESIGQAYRDFAPVTDEQVVDLLREAARPSAAQAPAPEARPAGPERV
jgi:putative phosphoribosyl transferase